MKRGELTLKGLQAFVLAAVLLLETTAVPLGQAVWASEPVEGELGEDENTDLIEGDTYSMNGSEMIIHEVALNEYNCTMSKTDGNYVYYINGNYTYEENGMQEPCTKVTFAEGAIPESYNGYQITTIEINGGDFVVGEYELNLYDTIKNVYNYSSTPVMVNGNAELWVNWYEGYGNTEEGVINTTYENVDTFDTENCLARSGDTVTIKPKESYSLYGINLSSNNFNQNNNLSWQESYIEHFLDGTKVITIPNVSSNIWVNAGIKTQLNPDKLSISVGADYSEYALFGTEPLNIEGEDWYGEQFTIAGVLDSTTNDGLITNRVYEICELTETADESHFKSEITVLEEGEDVTKTYVLIDKSFNSEDWDGDGTIDSTTNGERYGEIITFDYTYTMDLASPVIDADTGVTITGEDGKPVALSGSWKPIEDTDVIITTWTNQLPVTVTVHADKGAGLPISGYNIHVMEEENSEFQEVNSRTFTKTGYYELAISVQDAFDEMTGNRAQENHWVAALGIDTVEPRIYYTDDNNTDENITLISNYEYEGTLYLTAEDDASDVFSVTVYENVDGVWTENNNAVTALDDSGKQYSISPMAEDKTYRIVVLDTAGNETIYENITLKVEEVEILNDETGIPDTNLYNAILSAADGKLGDEKDNVLTVSEAEALTELSAVEKSIESLQGISYCKNLTSLSLVGCGIGDIAPLAELTNLSTLNLAENQITDPSVSELGNLTNLKSLDISNNQITKESSLEELQAALPDTTILSDGNPILVTEIVLNLTSISLEVGTSEQLSAAISPTMAANPILEWKSSNSDIVEVDAAGKVTAVAASTTPVTITATATDGSGVSASCEVTVTEPKAEETILTRAEILDENLYNAILSAADSNGDTVLTVSEAEELTSLTANEAGIADLTGISYCKNLKELQLRCNNISDIGELSNLTNLTGLWLDENDISDISALANLLNLTSLFLNDNSIEDISALSQLVDLNHLWLHTNNISNINVLSKLTNLRWLNICKNRINTIDALSNLTNLTDLNLFETNISDISALSELVNLEDLDLRWNSISDINALSKLTKLSRLNLLENNVSDISVLANLTNLTWVNLSFNNITDISVLESLPKLESYEITGNPIGESGEVILNDKSGIPDGNLYAAILAAADGKLTGKLDGVLNVGEVEKITYLTADEAGIADLTGISYCVNLEDLQLCNNNITDISELSKMKSLRALNLEGNDINDISMISDLVNLTFLNLQENDVGNISALSNLTNLTRLYLAHTNIKDISMISDLINLDALGLDDNDISNISALSNLTNLTTLNLARNSISDISALSELKNLDWLNLDENSISNASALSNLNNLTTLYLYNNSVKDISVISKLTNLISLDLGANGISNISILSGLKNLEYVYLQNNNISDISVISNWINLKQINLSNNNITDASVLDSLPNLEYDISGNPVSGSDSDSGEIEIPVGILLPESGVFALKAETPYSLGDGTWKVTGDTTSYPGGITFYIPVDGEYEFTVE